MQEYQHTFTSDASNGLPLKTDDLYCCTVAPCSVEAAAPIADFFKVDEVEKKNVNTNFQFSGIFINNHKC